MEEKLKNIVGAIDINMEVVYLISGFFGALIGVFCGYTLQRVKNSQVLLAAVAVPILVGVIGIFQLSEGEITKSWIYLIFAGTFIFAFLISHRYFRHRPAFAFVNW